MTTLIVICCLIYIAKNIDENKVTDIFTLLWYLFLAIIHIPYFIICGCGIPPISRVALFIP